MELEASGRGGGEGFDLTNHTVQIWMVQASFMVANTSTSLPA